MQSFDLQNFKTINTIIERDSKDTPYKYALLRGAVEISQEYRHLKRENRVPGLAIQKKIIFQKKKIKGLSKGILLFNFGV